MANKNFYDILNVRKDASPDEIKRAFRNLAKQYHPDKNPAPDAKEKFAQLKEAHDVLSNPTKRHEYDEAKRRGYNYSSDDNTSMPNTEHFRDFFEHLFPGFDDFTRSGTHERFSENMRKSNSNSFRAREQSKEQNSSRNVEYDRTGFRFGPSKRKPDWTQNSSFCSSFDSDDEPNISTKRCRSEPSKNSNTTSSGSSLPKDAAIEKHLEVTLEDISTGNLRKLKIKRKIFDERGNYTVEEKLIEITIKPGWKAGTKVTFPGLGDKHPGREPADITFIIKDKQHALFSRDSDNNLLHTANVSLKKALLGVSYCIQGLNGKRHDINIRDIVHPGYIKRYTGEGLPLPKTPSKSGDLIVTFNIQFPSYLSWDQRRVLSDCLPN
ncbi:dnaJ homolog subfamily B member 4-like isoform X2 [Xenia sp. Carnegie-2017]|uniref:dnaJ homolog subfamily B member 4-like isoform X2 n=1 Tax=Xenia sp. Carnegie-2017 TaxID=2897299 RepID=UPI001F035B22|nr:dnaJ homolog subfamily B member 4-like isoform X2 [Xenia sp. Carnegie-2017]